MIYVAIVLTVALATTLILTIKSVKSFAEKKQLQTHGDVAVALVAPQLASLETNSGRFAGNA